MFGITPKERELSARFESSYGLLEGKAWFKEFFGENEQFSRGECSLIINRIIGIALRYIKVRFN
jgi:hypothetical protein